MKKLFNNYKNLNTEDKTMLFLIFTTIGNILLSIVKFILSIVLPSLWFFFFFLFMVVLSFVRFLSIRDYGKSRNKDEKIKQEIGYRNYLKNGILLIILGIMYFFVNVYIYFKGTNTTMHEYLTYLVALDAFWSIGYSIYGMAKYKRNSSPILKAVKLTNFANALTSIMLTQIVLLDTYANSQTYNSNIMNGITGIVVSISIMIIGLYMIIGINKIKKIE